MERRGTNMLQLHAEIKAADYPGSYSIVRNYLQPFRAAGTSARTTEGPAHGQLDPARPRHPR